MRPENIRHSLMILTTGIVVTCVGIAYHQSGIYHETANVKNMLICLVIVLVTLQVFADPIKFIIMAVDMAIWPPPMTKFRPYSKEDDNIPNHDRLDFLKQRLRAMKSQMRITERYRNEQLNTEYRNIVQDLHLHFKYFIVLATVVLVSRNELTYYNTNTLNKLIMYNHTSYIGLNAVYHLNQLFDFIQSTLVNAFNELDANGISIWVHNEQTKMLGVVRMRQLRLAREQFGYGEPEYTEQYYKPDWQLPYQQYHYADKYWRIYDPWVPMHETELSASILLNFHHHAQMHNYPELKGYVALLGRSKENSLKILEFLEDYNWLTYNTCAVFMDFTLYNIDGDMFSVCTLWVEQTAFGSIIPGMNCDSIQLIIDSLQSSYKRLFILLIYLFTFTSFIHSFLIHIWYEPRKLQNIWFRLDLFIILVNIVLIAMILVRASIVATMLKRLEGANKLEFPDFRIPSRLYALCNILTGFLISASTLRLWKVMQFAKVFQIFTRTLSSARMALVITCGAIVIFLGAFGIATTIINGNNDLNFSHPITSIVSILCFSFGFKSEIRPEDLFHGGKYLGVILYVTMGFVISVLLLNVFSTLIFSYFIEAKKLGDEKFKEQITFLQYLRVEYDRVFRFIRRIFRAEKSYKRNDRTVAENIQIKLAKREHKYKPLVEKKSEHFLQVEYRERIELTISIACILDIQMEILETILFTDAEEQQRQQRAKHHPKSRKTKQNVNDNSMV